jgi:hypothetical protein
MAFNEPVATVSIAFHKVKSAYLASQFSMFGKSCGFLLFDDYTIALSS